MLTAKDRLTIDICFPHLEKTRFQKFLEDIRNYLEGPDEDSQTVMSEITYKLLTRDIDAETKSYSGSLIAGLLLRALRNQIILVCPDKDTISKLSPGRTEKELLTQIFYSGTIGLSVKPRIIEKEFPLPEGRIIDIPLKDLPKGMIFRGLLFTEEAIDRSLKTYLGLGKGKQ